VTLADRLADELRCRAFTPRPRTATPPKIGAEVEVIPVDASSRRVVPLAVTVPMLRALARRCRWVERPSPYGAPMFSLGSAGQVSFEPGGQIEFSAAPSASVSELLARIRGVTDAVRHAAADSGIDLLSVGIDPVNPVECVPRQLHGKRYVAMDEYLATRGPNGARMMRQTAAFQMSLDVGTQPAREWRLLNALAPYVVAIFANSPTYAGQQTGHRSYRAHVWRTLDPTRTGLPASAAEDPAAEYTEFALRAPAIMPRAADGSFRPFGELLETGVATSDDWATHLSTLFPEVRPRGTFEVRSADALPTQWYAAPLVFLSGLIYDATARAEAAVAAGDADPSRLIDAGRYALSDPALARGARDLAEIALAGAARLGPAYVTPGDLEVARDFFDQYTHRGRSPADDS
jgi:glutamate--cysteine ligase